MVGTAPGPNESRTILPMSKLSPVLPPATGSATDLVVAALRDEIDGGLLKPGVALRQDELASRFGTSRIPVREALRTLQAEGLVTYCANRGATVALVSETEMLEMLEVRIALECHAIRLSVPQVVEADIEKARSLLTEYDKAPAAAQWSAMNWAFHWALYVPCDCSRLLSAIERNFKQFNSVARHHISKMAGKERPQREHYRLLGLAEAGKANEAAQLLRDHILDTQRSIRADGRRH